MSEEARGDEPYFLDEPRRREEEALASGRRAQNDLRGLISQGDTRANYWDQIFKQLGNARPEQERKDVTHCEE